MSLQKHDPVRWCDEFATAFHNALSRAGLVARLRCDAGREWADVSSALSYLPVDYSQSVLDYYQTYWPGVGVPFQDASVVLYHDNRPCAIWPLALVKDGTGLWKLSSNGGSVKPPLLVPGLARKSRKSLALGCVSALAWYAEWIGQAEIESEEGFTEEHRLSDWHDRLMQCGGRVRLVHDMFLDLRPSIAEIKGGFRKSYKALVTSGSKLWSVNLLTTADVDLWQEFRVFHRSVAGRITRCNESWRANHDAIASGNAFFVYLRSGDGKMVGGGLFYVTRDEGLYSIGAYDRSLFDKPLGHVVQYYAIEEMKRRGIRWYRLGVRSYRGDEPPPSDKDITISQFKQGFSSHLLPRYRINCLFPGEVLRL